MKYKCVKCKAIVINPEFEDCPECGCLLKQTMNDLEIEILVKEKIIEDMKDRLKQYQKELDDLKL